MYFESAHSKRFTGAFCGTADSIGVSDWWRTEGRRRERGSERGIEGELASEQHVIR